MRHYVHAMAPVLIAGLVLGPLAGAQEQPAEAGAAPEKVQVISQDRPANYVEQEKVPLSQQELRDMTDQVMAKNPMLSSSAGIKYAEAFRYRGDEVWAVIIYYPHTENAGIKEAFQVNCLRNDAGTSWACEEAEIRRYLSLDSQGFEVRVTGPISSEAAMAFIEATRKALPAPTAWNADVPDTATMLSSYDGRGHVSWVNREGSASQVVKARLREGGDPTRVEDWIIE